MSDKSSVFSSDVTWRREECQLQGIKSTGHAGVNNKGRQWHRTF